MEEVDSWMGQWVGSVGMLNHGVIFDLGSAKVCSTAIIEIYFYCDKDIWIAVTYYHIFT